MKKEILLSGIISLAVHVLILSAPMSKANNTKWNAHRAISISIIHPHEGIVSAPPVEASTEAAIRPLDPVKGKVSLKQTISPEKRVTPKGHLAPKPVARNTATGDLDSEGGKEIDGGIAAKTASISNDILAAGWKNTGILQPRVGRAGDNTALDAPPRYKETPPPNYPKDARRAGYEGRTLLRVEVLESGKVGQLEIATSSGFEVLDRAALKSVKSWTFVPGTRNGKKTKQWVMVPVRFSLR